MSSLHVLGAGAAKGLVQAVHDAFHAKTGAKLESSFGPVGTIRARWMSGEPCDVIILTAAMIEELAGSGYVSAGSTGAIGGVQTAIAVRAGEATPRIGDADALKRTLLAADALYCPDMGRSTAGTHFARVINELAIRDTVAARLREYPTGANAMHALAASEGAAIGCTQVTEILQTPGIQLVGPLPAGFELTTVYSAGVSAQAALPHLALELVHLLTSDTTLELRRVNGFETDPNSTIAPGPIG